MGLALGGSASLHAQRNWADADWGGGAPGWFDAQAEGSYDEAGRPIALVSVTVPYRNLIFLRQPDGRFRAGYRIRIVQYDHRGRNLRLREYDGTVVVDDYDSTRDTTPLKRVIRFPLLSGSEEEQSDSSQKIRLSVRVEIDHSKRWGRRELFIARLREAAEKVALGDLVLYRDLLLEPWPEDAVLRLPEGSVDPQRFEKVSVPIFDLSSGPPWALIRVYDLRPRAAADSVEVRLSTARKKGERARWSRTFRLPSKARGAALLVRIPPTALKMGKNVVVLRGAGEEDRREAELQDFGLDPASDRQWKANLKVIEELATSEELKELGEAPPEAREGLWDRFWRRRDPDPSTAANERLRLHVRRVIHARRQLRDGGKDGALSDRGRVYIRYGAPDSIESQTMLQDSSAEYEIWHYLEPGLSFYFRDEDGLGHWRLVWRQES